MRIVSLKEHIELIPTLAEWHHRQWAYLNPRSSVEKRIASLTAQTTSEDIPQTFIAVRGATLLGSASLVPHDMETRMELFPWLASVFVAPEQRNRGVGSALVRHTVEEAARRGYETIYLFTPDREALYRHLGWSLLERAEYHGHRVDIMMIRPTSSEAGS
jgi:predicted N-acetyltransferase YhbS